MTPGCPHPLCQQSIDRPRWFPGGTTLNYFPLLIPDPAYPRGKMDCNKCQGKMCYGYFVSPELASLSSLSTMTNPPSKTLKDAFNRLKGKELTESHRKKLAQATLLPMEEVQMWFDHLKTIQDNRKQGAAKAAMTRQLKRSKQKRFFCICGEEYLSVTNEVQDWIGCDSCSSWFHFECVGVTPESLPESFICSQCSV